MLFGEVWTQFADGTTAAPPAWTFAIAPLREILTGAVVLFIIRRIDLKGARGALLLGLVLWLGFYVVQLSGAIMFDNMPWQLGAVHAGDWLMKMLVITSAVYAWHKRLTRRG
jgi:hypothetical protein